MAPAPRVRLTAHGVPTPLPLRAAVQRRRAAPIRAALAGHVSSRRQASESLMRSETAQPTHASSLSPGRVARDAKAQAAVTEGMFYPN